MINSQYSIDYFNELPLIIKVVWVFSFVLFLTIILLTIYLKIFRSYLRKKDQEKVKFKTEYEGLLVTYLYSSSDPRKLNPEQEAIILQLQNSLKSASERKIIISVLYNLMNEVSGEMSESIKTFYYKTGLIDYALAKLKNKNWYTIAKGIGELTRFNIVEAHDHISKFIKHPRNEVRNATQLYLVNLFRFNGLHFLDDLNVPLSEWVQVQLLETLQKFDDQQICNIQPWLKSTNNTVILFALKLAQIYNQFEVKDSLIELLSHSNKEIRVKAIDVLSHLYGIEAKEILKTNFNELSLEEQISFFGLLEKLVVPSDEPFVEKHLFHKNFEIQLLALKILKSINVDKFKWLSNSAKTNYNSEMIEYVNNI
ncbi:HEAT repeat domain-containing protein [Confluentibacter sediminis]|uniref:HEAT repeat domain-containing protein n=1 Tax=Confluentibacter sediminis TaxID=2219045 RepID=UPI000DADFA08|nr:HEAT repeat domain-containing protein [Confluentibacter sediminis]